MVNFLSNNPIYFPIVFIAMWVGLMWAFSLIGGWGSLAKHYKTDESFSGVKTHMQTVRVGPINYGSCITIGLNSSQIYMAILFPFRIAHKPLLIPFCEIEAKEQQGFMSNYVSLKIQSARIRISKRHADKMVSISNETWQYSRS